MQLSLAEDLEDFVKGLWWQESTCQCRRLVEDTGSISGSRRSPGEGNGNPLQDSCLGNLMDRGAWHATVHGVAKESDMTEQTCKEWKNFFVSLNIWVYCEIIFIFYRFFYLVSGTSKAFLQQISVNIRVILLLYWYCIFTNL